MFRAVACTALVLRYVLLPFLIMGDTYASNQSGPEMVAVAICNLRLYPRLAVAFVNRLILNVITTVAIRLLSYYELPNTVYTYFSMSSANSFSIKSNFDQFVLTFSLMF